MPSQAELSGPAQYHQRARRGGADAGARCRFGRRSSRLGKGQAVSHAHANRILARRRHHQRYLQRQSGVDEGGARDPRRDGVPGTTRSRFSATCSSWASTGPGAPLVGPKGGQGGDRWVVSSRRSVRAGSSWRASRRHAGRANYDRPGSRRRGAASARSGEAGRLAPVQRFAGHEDGKSLARTQGRKGLAWNIHTLTTPSGVSPPRRRQWVRPRSRSEFQMADLRFQILPYEICDLKSQRECLRLSKLAPQVRLCVRFSLDHE